MTAALAGTVLLALAAWWLGLIALAATAWIVAFFRDPERQGPRGDDLVIAPADGKVVSVVTLDETAFHGGPANRISIFMNVFNVHVNRYPSNGRITFCDYVPGTFGNAARDKASLDNEQSSVGLETARGKVLVRQIAGLLARRIVTDHPEGTTVQQGERMGLIRFGSRVDLFLPLAATVLVRVGDHTKAGLTVVARWN